MATVRSCSFLAYVDLRYHPCCSTELPERSEILELLKAKQFQAAMDLVKSGQLAIKAPLPGLGSSLLQVAMTRTHKKVPEAADVQILLNAMKFRGEMLDGSDLEAACNSGSSSVVKLLLERGAPLSQDSLHVLLNHSGNTGLGAFGETIRAVTLLLNANANIDELGSRRETPLVTVCKGVGFSTSDIIEWLLNHRADPCGAAGHRAPLHVFQSGNVRGVKLLVDHRADVNQKDNHGNTPMHYALYGHENFQLAMQLKTLGADCSIVTRDGLRPSQILLAQNKPALAAELEERQMNEEEQTMQTALEHPVAKLFHMSDFLNSIGWTICSPPDHLRSMSDGDLQDACPSADRKLSDLLGGCSPETVVVGFPLTRYHELREEVAFKAPVPEGFTVRSLLMEIYKYYQEPFDAAQTERIQKFFEAGQLGDTFGYIRHNILPESADQDEGPPAAKKRQVARIELRGDSIFYEGFNTCKYFEDERKLCGSLSFGS
eukprot:TRINITY_DN19298_c0_g1_i2.p1 TRINITY_DN19298_c0_g1~~TRINITY_DN19298_c0_g1_i2.p1  ORF type:complete len:489 (+),score=62.59 TRINITY_DN19298_c0_g1_i2:45-1511(+)